MIKKCYLVASLLLLMAAVAGPSLVSAEGDSLASPTPTPPERVTAPEIFGINPNVVLSEGNQGETLPSDIIAAFDIHLPVLVDLPDYVQLEPQHNQGARTNVKSLSIPLRTQDPGEVTCGLQALGMVMDFIGPSSSEAVPTDDQLVSYISSQGLLYEWGTGVEELAYTAREFGYAGSYAFHNWSLKQLTEQLHQGKPVVVSLGANGANKPGHFVTVTGISDDGHWVTYNDPILGRMTVPANEFLTQWKLQGNAGLLVQKETLPPAVDPMLPWMGIFSALSMLTLVAGKSGTSESSRVFNDLRRKLADPKRKGIGGGLTAPVVLEPNPVKVPRYGTKTVYRGLKTVKLEVPVYKTKKVKVGIRGYKKKVPIYETRRVEVGFNTVSKRIPEYTTKRVKAGTKTIKQQIPVTRYRNTKVMEWKKTTRMVPVYWTLGSQRIRTGTRKETRWKKVPVIKRVAYESTKTIFRQVSEYRDVKVLRGYRTVTEKVPKYELKKIIAGYKTVNVTEPVYEEQQIQVGTETVTRQVPDYQTVQIPDPPPPTGFSPGVWEKLSRKTQLKILAGGSAAEKNSKTVDDIEKGWLVKTIENIQKKKQQINEFLENHGIQPASKNSQNLLSISIQKKQDVNFLTEDGVIISSNTPPNIWDMLYVEQKLNIERKVVLTSFPGGIVDVNLSSKSCKIKLGDNAIFASLNGEIGFVHKLNKEVSEYAYQQTKHSVILSQTGLTSKVKEESVFILDHDSSDKVQKKLVKTLKCETKTIKTESLAIVAGVAIVLIVAVMTNGAGVEEALRLLTGTP